MGGGWQRSRLSLQDAARRLRTLISCPWKIVDCASFQMPGFFWWVVYSWSQWEPAEENTCQASREVLYHHLYAVIVSWSWIMWHICPPFSSRFVQQRSVSSPCLPLYPPPPHTSHTLTQLTHRLPPTLTFPQDPRDGFQQTISSYCYRVGCIPTAGETGGQW